METKLTEYDIQCQNAMCVAIGNQVGQTAMAVAAAILSIWAGSEQRSANKIGTFIATDPSYPNMQMVVAMFDGGPNGVQGTGYVQVTFYIAIDTLFIEAWRATASEAEFYQPLSDTAMVSSVEAYARILPFVELMKSTYTDGPPPLPGNTIYIAKS